MREAETTIKRSMPRMVACTEPYCTVSLPVHLAYRAIVRGTDGLLMVVYRCYEHRAPGEPA